MAKHHLESHTPHDVIVLGRVSGSQDSVVVDRGGVAPCHTAGHGNCPKVLVIIED